MFNLDISFSIIILVLDLFGTAVFAVTGALRAIEHKYDIVGIIILATITGIFGGVMRDTILGIFPPSNFSDTVHIVLTTITATIIFFLYHRTKEHENLFNIFDAVGLGVFTFTGASIAYSLYSTNNVLIVISSLLTAFGGGILRDVLVREPPIVFTKEVYAVASFIGVIIFLILVNLNIQFEYIAIAVIFGTTGIRLVSIKLHWNLPKVKT
ncbi:MAG TPA: trimeric intracellular cation channel family protein [Nitrososphaeraceae archaeon]